MLLAKANLNSIEVLISKALIGSNVSHDESISINNVLKEYDDIKEEIKNLKTYTVLGRFQSIYKIMLSYCFLTKESIENI